MKKITTKEIMHNNIEYVRFEFLDVYSCVQAQEMPKTYYENYFKKIFVDHLWREKHSYPKITEYNIKKS